MSEKTPDELAERAAQIMVMLMCCPEISDAEEASTFAGMNQIICFVLDISTESPRRGEMSDLILEKVDEILLQNESVCNHAVN